MGWSCLISPAHDTLDRLYPSRNVGISMLARWWEWTVVATNVYTIMGQMRFADVSLSSWIIQHPKSSMRVKPIILNGLVQIAKD